MWEVTYTITPNRGYFDAAEPLMWDAGIWLDLIHKVEFVSDGSVAIVYEVSGDTDRLLAAIDESDHRWIEYSLTGYSTPMIIKLRFVPDDWLEELFAYQRAFGVAMQFPFEYVAHDPSTLEVTEVGSREEIRQHLDRIRDLASVEITRLSPYEPGTDQLYRDLTDRQQEVLQVAVELGYFNQPREATHEDIAEVLECSTSVVGDHLRRIESALVDAVMPGGTGAGTPETRDAETETDSPPRRDSSTT